MRLFYDPQTKWFMLICDYEDRRIPAAAGFVWNKLAQVWWTTDYVAAKRLIEDADESAIAEIKKQEKEAEQSREASVAQDAEIDIPVPDGLNYLGYQKAGIAFALQRKGTLIADEMGLGKTIQVIGYLNATKAQRATVVCPASLKINWMRELRRWLVESKRIHIVNADTTYISADIVIINYDILERKLDLLKEAGIGVLIADESHYVKNPKAKRTEVMKELASLADAKLFLTGTPILNRPVELIPILQMLGMEIRWFDFVKRYCAAYKNQWGWQVKGASNLGELQDLLRSKVMVRRLKQDVLTELPPKRRQIIEIPASELRDVIENERVRRHAVETARRRARVEAEQAKGTGNYSERVRELNTLELLYFNELAKVRHETALAKVPYVIDYVKDILESTNKVVVFAHHKDVIAQIATGLKQFGVVMLDGDTKTEDRQRAVDSFQSDPSVRVFIGSLYAAGVGITLTSASIAVFAELDWTPATITQAEDRLHRIGQHDSVLVQHIVVDSSIDADIAKKLLAKQEVITAALDAEPIQLEYTESN